MKKPSRKNSLSNLYLTQLKEVFSYNRLEQRGIMVLLVLIFLVIALQAALPLWKKEHQVDFSEYEAEIGLFKRSLVISSNNNSTSNSGYSNIVPQQQAVLFPFDPNTITYKEWKMLGLKDYQAKIISKYVAMGGKFFKKEDLQRIYSISMEDYLRLEPFIKLPEKETGLPQWKRDNVQPLAGKPKADTLANLVLDLNMADSASLVLVRGIGPSFARRILKYRGMLGGYVNVNQLLEVYGMDSTRYRQIQSHFTTSSGHIKKININTATFSELMHHPYIGYDLTKKIVSFRDKRKKFKNLEELLKIEGILEKTVEKLKPYLEVR